MAGGENGGGIVAVKELLGQHHSKKGENVAEHLRNRQSQSEMTMLNHHRTASKGANLNVSRQRYDTV